MSMKAAGDSMVENAATPMEAGTADFESHVTVVLRLCDFTSNIIPNIIM